MAIGADSTLPKSQAPVLRSQAAASRQSFNVARPPMIADSRVQGAVNNQLASSAGAREMSLQSANNTKGVSRGKGMAYTADIAQSAADADARASAAGTEMGAAASNAAAQFAYDSALRNEQLGNAGLLEGMRGASKSEALNNQALRQQVYEAMRRGQFGLDQMQLDTTPLLSKLFS